VGGIIELIERLGRPSRRKTLLTDVGRTKGEVARKAKKVFRQDRPPALAGLPWLGQGTAGAVDFADPDLVQGAAVVFDSVRG